MFLVGPDMQSIGMVAYSVYGAWQKADYCVLAKYDKARTDLTIRYWRAVSEKLKLGASFYYNVEKLEPTVRECEPLWRNNTVCFSRGETFGMVRWVRARMVARVIACCSGMCRTRCPSGLRTVVSPTLC